MALLERYRGNVVKALTPPLIGQLFCCSEVPVSLSGVLCSTGPTRAQLLVQKARKAAEEGIIGDEDPLLAVSPCTSSACAIAAMALADVHAVTG